MANKNWRKMLRSIQHNSVSEQQIIRSDILFCWEKLLASNPTREEFTKLMSGIVFMPEMVYDIWKGKGNGKKTTS